MAGVKRELKTMILEKEDGLAVITLNNPDRLNAMSPQQIFDLVEVFSELEKDEDIRCAVITGKGRAFLAGGDVESDIKPLASMTPQDFNIYMKRADYFYRTIAEMEKPVIAAINGIVVGAGLDLAMCCDIRIASEKAQLGQFFVRMGLLPESGAYLMPRLVGLGMAKLLSFTGDLIDAKEAERIGLVEKVVPHDELMPYVMKLAKRFAGGPRCIGIMKKQLNEAMNMNFETALDYAIRLQYQCIHTQDHKEAVDAFLEKRKPVFKGK